MTTGAKIAVGCLVAVLLAAGLAIAGVFGVAWWGKKKFDEVTGGPGGIERMAGAERETRRHQEEANRNPFTPPADGVIEEARLVMFLGVRREVFAVYERHKDFIQRQGNKKAPDLALLGEGVRIISELRLAQAKAQADHGMSDGEYRFLVEQVYKAAWATGVAKGTGGRSPSEATRDLSRATREALERQLDNPDLPPDARRRLEETLRTLEAQTGEAERAASQLDVPQANLDLFRKHQEEIQKYAMSGLELLGL